ncbi:MAG: DUF1343 domain-containing protein [Caldilineaceae bacterium]
MPTTLHFGVDHLVAARLADLRGLRIGLVTNDAATTALLPRPLMPVRQALQQMGVNLVRLFAPEHGMGASAHDGANIADAVDPLTGLPVVSLYGATFQPTAAMLADLDLLLFDIPDVGVRFYTYIWTLSHLLEACGAVGLPLWVLDRPNPLGGDLALAEGPILDETQISSFVGRWAIPIRHSLTVGELAQMWNQERGLAVDLTVVPVMGWARHQQWPFVGLPFVPMSPAMPSYQSALLYPGTCLFEGTKLSEGRGTATPFQLISAPWLDAIAVAQTFNQLQLTGVLARSAQCIPCAGKYANQLCQGVMLHVLNAHEFRPVAAGLQLLWLISQQHPDEFQWLPYPTAANAPGYGHFDRLIGRLDIRTALTATRTAPADLIAQWTTLPQWPTQVQPYLLYV